MDHQLNSTDELAAKYLVSASDRAARNDATDVRFAVQVRSLCHVPYGIIENLITFLVTIDFRMVVMSVVEVRPLVLLDFGTNTAREEQQDAKC